MRIDPALKSSTRGRFNDIGRVDSNVEAHHKGNADGLHLFWRKAGCDGRIKVSKTATKTA